MAPSLTGFMTVLTLTEAGMNMAVENEKDLSVAHIVLMSQQKYENSSNTLLGETLGSAVLDSGASSTVSGTKWL